MRVFEVQYGTTLFIEVLSWVDLAFSATQIEQANARLLASLQRPEAVRGIVSASAQEDDGHDEDEVKVFVLVSLRIQAEDENAVEHLLPPNGVLGKVIARLFQDAHVESSLAFEQPWEVLAVKDLT